MKVDGTLILEADFWSSQTCFLSTKNLRQKAGKNNNKPNPAFCILSMDRWLELSTHHDQEPEVKSSAAWAVEEGV